MVVLNGHFEFDQVMNSYNKYFTQSIIHLEVDPHTKYCYPMLFSAKGIGERRGKNPDEGRTIP